MADDKVYQIYQYVILLSIIGLAYYFAVTANDLKQELITAIIAAMQGTKIATSKKEIK
ncbi:hypothetical protein [Candidatus Epulonipiscium viviparus]|uniref:hypothetical protein n=1 Tax=Candidatus Epulonipiscium viviparus TaxID=420336 RepID=UPI00016C0EC0|nr:hypothetical protein [Candidatus Epulopiscium viviparus]